MYRLAGKPVYVFVANFGERSAHLHKHMLISIVDEMPQCVVHLSRDKLSSSSGDVESSGEAREQTMENTDPINAVYYKPARDRKHKRFRQMIVL